MNGWCSCPKDFLNTMTLRKRRTKGTPFFSDMEALDFFEGSPKKAIKALDFLMSHGGTGKKNSFFFELQFVEMFPGLRIEKQILHLRSFQHRMRNHFPICQWIKFWKMY